MLPETVIVLSPGEQYANFLDILPQAGAAKIATIANIRCLQGIVIIHGEEFSRQVLQYHGLDFGQAVAQRYDTTGTTYGLGNQFHDLL